MTRTTTTYTMLLMALSMGLSACKTSGDIASGRDYVDPTEVKTVENAALDEKVTPRDPETLTRELEIAQGELETIKQLTSSEQEKLKARIAELEKQNIAMAEALNKGSSPQEPAASPQDNQSPSSPKKESGAAALWLIAVQDLKAGKFQQAISPLEEIIKIYPKDKLSFPALANLALAQYRTQHFNDAAVTFNQFIDKYPKKKELALAWFGQAVSFAQLKQHDDSRLLLEEVVKRYPLSNEAALAKKVLKKKEKIPSDLFGLASNYPAISAF